MQDAIGEIQLIEQSLAGSREAFGILVVRYQSLICSITYSATGDLARSQELAQETFLKAWKNLKQLREFDRFRAWLCRIARNVVNKSVRKQRFDVVHKARPLDEATAGITKADVYYSLGLIHEQLNETKKAVNMFERGLELKPDHADLQAALARVKG